MNLHSAVASGRIIHINDINEGCFIWGKGEELCECAKNGHVENLKHLIRAGADIDTNKKEGCTPLYWGAREGHVDVVKVLIEAGADVDANKEAGFTPLNWAAENGHTEMVKILIAAGADVEANKKDGWTPLYHSALNGHTDIVKELIKAGAEVDANKKRGLTPLFISTKNGFTENVKILINAGADVNVNKESGKTPLYWSVTKGYRDISRLLICAGAGIHVEETGQFLTKYEMLYQPSLNCEKNNSLLYKLWEECQVQVKQMKETRLGRSTSHFFQFITEKNQNKLAFYASEESFCLNNDFERLNYIKKFSIYAEDIECLFNEGRKRAILLHEGQELMMRVFAYTLPLNIIRKISEYMSNYDIENVLALNNISM